MPDEVFGSLFAPLPRAEFLARHWKRRPLLAGAAPWRTHVRYSLEEFLGGLERFPKVKAQFLAAGRHRELPIEGREAQALYDAGLSICVSFLEEQAPALEEFADRIRDELRFAGQVVVNAYWSPAGAGFGTHFDEQHVFILQLAGSKRWSISEGVGCEAPPANLVFSGETAAAFRARHPDLPLTPPDAVPFVDHLLRPGDCLYLPPGTWHRTAAGDFSFALTLTLVPMRCGDLFAEIGRRWFERSLPWREALPVDETFADGGSSASLAFLAERIAEFRAFAARLTPEALAEEWRSATLGPGAAGAADDGGEVGDEEILLRPRRLELSDGTNGRGEEVVVLHWAGGRCEIPGEYRAFCRTLAAETRFTPAQARSWSDAGGPLDAGETREVLAELLRAGLLRRS